MIMILKMNVCETMMILMINDIMSCVMKMW